MRRIALLAPVFAILLAAPAAAEEIIYFTNGSQMPIRGHAVEQDDQMIHVDLGDNAFMAFPFAKVERIEKAGENVFLTPSSASANKMIQVKPVPGGSAPVRASKPAHRKAWERARTHGTDNESHRVVTDPDTGLASYRPYSYSSQRGKRKLRVVGNQAVLGGPVARNPGEGVTGTRPVGSSHQLPGVEPPKMYDTGRQLVGIEFIGDKKNQSGGTGGNTDARDDAGAAGQRTGDTGSTGAEGGSGEGGQS